MEHYGEGAEYLSLTIDAPPASGEINPADDQDLYQFAVTSPGWYKVETWLGSLEDSYMYLYGPNDPVIYIAEDDDSGEGRAARIWRYFDAGVYYFVVTSLYGAYIGTYTIGVTTAGTVGTISGRVTDESANGLEGIRIYAYDLNHEYISSVTTDAAGDYHISPLDAGSYKIFFYHSGLSFFSEWFNDKGSFADADEVVVPAGGTTANINAQLAVSGSISGRVTDGSGAGIGGIRVRACNSAGNYIAGAWTNADGDYSVPGLSSGNFKVLFGSYDGIYIPEWYNDKKDILYADLVTVAAGSDTPNINAILAQGGSISGRVTNASAAGIANVYVEVYGLDNNFTCGGYTDGNGDYSVVGLPSGTCKVVFDVYDQNYISEWYNDKGDFMSADPVAVTAGSDTPSINAVLAQGGSISGRVTNAAAVGIANVYVDVYDLDYNFICGGYTDGNGDYSVVGLPSGTYKVNFFVYAQNYISEWYDDKGDFTTADPVAVTAGSDTPSINAVLAQGGSISGRVTNASATGIANAFVDVYDLDYNYTCGGYTDGNGDYSVIGLPSGTFKVFFLVYAQNYISEWYDDKGDFTSAGPVAVTAGSDTPSINAVLAQGGTISGRVTNAAAEGIAGIGVRVYDLDYNYQAYAATDANGDYSANRLPTGSYKVHFNTSGLNYTPEWYDDKVDFWAADPVTVAAGGETQNINAVLAPGGSISGRVTDMSAVGIADLQVSVSSSDWSRWYYAYTDVNGDYTVAGMPSGSYYVEFWPNPESGQNYAHEWYDNKISSGLADPVPVTSGSDTPNIDAQLADGGVIQGRVTNSANAGLYDVYVLIYEPGGGLAFWNYTGSGGYYTVGNLPAGDYKINFYDWPGEYIPEWYNDKANFAAADLVAVTAGGTTPDINAQLAAAGSSDSLTVTAPNGGESWTAGSGQEITWTSTGDVGNVDILYTHDNGSTWHSLIADTANDGSHLWTVPDTPSGDCYVQVLEHADGSPYDASDAAFAILAVPPPSLELTSPNGWEHWTLGKTKPITWNAVNYTGTVRLVLFKAGKRFGNIAANIPAANGSYSWTVGQTYDNGMAPEGSDYRLYLRSSDNTLIDPSDCRLALIDPAQLKLTAPNGGESWELGTTQNITWKANGYTGTVRLILFQKAAKIGQIAANLPAGQGSYAWTVGVHQAGIAPAGINYSIRLLAGDGSQDDFSDGPLTLIENDALIVDHQHTAMNAIPQPWLDQASRQKLLVLGAKGDDAMTLGLRLLGDRDSRLAATGNSNSLGLVLSEGSWLPQGADFELQEWRWSLEKAILESQATVAVIRPDEQAILAGKLNAEGYLASLAELANRLPDVKLVCSTVAMDDPDDVLAKFNRQVRESALMNKGILLDTADIESWRNNRQQLVRDVPVRHPAYRAASGVPATDNLANQAAAAWWLLARMAGWEGEVLPGTKMR